MSEYTDFLTFREQDEIANLQEQLDAMNDADLTDKANTIMSEFHERCAEVYHERQAGRWCDAPRLTHREQAIMDEYWKRNG